MTKILAIDPSLTGTAYIYGDIDDMSTLEHKYFSDKKMDIKNEHCVEIPKGYTGEQKLDLVLQHIMLLCANNPVDLIVLESPSYSSCNTSDAFKTLYGLITWFARQVKIKYLLIPPITSKLYFTNNARAEKIDMVNQAISEFGCYINFENVSKKHCEDIADALSLYSLGTDYLKCANLGRELYFQTGDIKYYDFLLPYRKMVVAKLYNRQDLYKQADKERKALQF